MSKSVKFGFKNVHVAKLTESNGAITYGTPFEILGGVNFSADPEGNTNPFMQMIQNTMYQLLKTDIQEV